MAIKTPQEYLQSLRDDRIVYCKEELVKDVTKHPLLKIGVSGCAMDYVAAHTPEFRDTVVTQDEEGEDISYVFTPARNVDDLLRYREIVQLMARIRFGQPGGAKFTGVDALHALTVGSKDIDKATGSNYSERVEEYRKYLLKNDSAIVACMTDVKGNRSLRPSKQEPHQDYYLRIVDAGKDGIVVRGAKMHISHATCANEMIVMPCRAMGEEDRDYAVAFAIPVNAKGITLITSDEVSAEEENYFDYPISASMYSSSGMVVFDDVEPVEKVKVYDCGVDIEDEPLGLMDWQLIYRTGDIHVPKLDTTEPLKVECNHFIECICKRKQPRSDGESGLRVVRVLNAIEKSVREAGKAVAIRE